MPCRHNLLLITNLYLVFTWHYLVFTWHMDIEKEVEFRKWQPSKLLTNRKHGN
jgi:hypothetical protein